MTTATCTHKGDTKNKMKYKVTAGLADLGTLYFPKGSKLPESFEIEIPLGDE